jgi:hypothetical protein
VLSKTGRTSSFRFSGIVWDPVETRGLGQVDTHTHNGVAMRRGVVLAGGGNKLWDGTAGSLSNPAERPTPNVPGSPSIWVALTSHQLQELAGTRRKSNSLMLMVYCRSSSCKTVWDWNILYMAGRARVCRRAGASGAAGHLELLCWLSHGWWLSYRSCRSWWNAMRAWKPNQGNDGILTWDHGLAGWSWGRCFEITVETGSFRLPRETGRAGSLMIRFRRGREAGGLYPPFDWQFGDWYQLR